jgi:hypothetical protein
LDLNGFFFFWNKISLAHNAFMKFLSKPMAMVSYVVDYYLNEMFKKCSKSYQKYVCLDTLIMGIAITNNLSSITWF